MRRSPSVLWTKWGHSEPRCSTSSRNPWHRRPWRRRPAVQQASTSAGAGPPQQPVVSTGRCGNGTAANAGFRQHQLDPLGRFLVAGDVGHDRAHLLVAGHHQKRRRAAIGLHAGEVEAGLGLRQLARAMRTHRAAAVQIGIDQRRQDRADIRAPDQARCAARARRTDPAGSRSRRSARRLRRAGRSRPSPRRAAASRLWR